MREIKFRAWDNESKKMIHSSDAKNYDVNTGREYFPFVFEIGYKGRRDLELMQFTGLKDKNGKEIYEGDVIRYVIEDHLNSVGDLVNDPIAYTEEVHFENGGFELDGCPVSVANEIGEVIGNIYENPELLN